MPAPRAAHRSAPTTGVEGDWSPLPGRNTSILFDVFVLGQRTRGLLQAAMREAGLRPDEYAAYSIVFERSPITLTELARDLHMPVTTVADYVRAMHSRRHLRKDANPADHRSSLLVLTPAGRRAHQRANAAFEVAYQAFVRELGVDEAHARAVLQAMTISAERALATLEPPDA
jgi:DNA-binding MarR family transcriptional regulator